MTFLAVMAFVLCAAVLAVHAYIYWPPATARPTPLPRPEPMPDLYTGRHRTVLIGG
jgi:hypothetical protein